MIEIEPCYRYYLACDDDVCFVEGDRNITHRQLLAASNRFAKLHQLSQGGRALVLMENRPEWAASFFSAWVNRGVAVPVDAMAPVSEIAYIVKDSEPEIIFCSNKTLDTAEKAVASSGVPAKIINVDTFVCDWDDVADVTPMPKHGDDDLAVLVYTSGTTSDAKGCMITFHNLEINFKSMTEEVPVWIPNQTTLALLPFHHILPLQGCLLMPIHAKNCKVVFCPTLNGPDIVKAIHDNRVTIFIAVPRVFQMFRDSMLKKVNANPVGRILFKISKAVGNIRLSRILFHSVQKAFGGCIRFFPTGGAALDYGIYYDLAALGFEMLPGCGMSETAPVVAFTHPGHPRKDSAGQMVDIIEGKIADDGEILLRGEGIIKAYWRKPEETAKTFTPDGWMHTGDLGRIDEDKFIYYTGRKKELIILSNGKNVPPLVIEDKVMALSDGLISEMAVIASGDVLGALILPDFKVISERNIVNVSETIRQTVIAKYNEDAEPYMRILKCTFITTPLPRTRLGKLKRHKLSELASLANGDVKRPEEKEPDLPEYAVIRDFLKNEQHCKEVHPSDHFEIDLGLDSLSKVEMLVFLNEAFGTEFQEQVLVDNPTPASLAEFLHKECGVSEIKQANVDWGKILKERTNDVVLPSCSFSHFPLNILSKGLQKMLFRTSSEGRENIPDGSCIFACNHQSYIDGLFVMAQFDRRTHVNTIFYAKQQHAGNSIAKHLASRHNIILVDMNRDLKGSLQKLAVAIEKGKKVAIFPEGTRTNDGTLGNFKTTFAILAKELNVPIVPVVIDGAYEILPRGTHFPRFFKRVKISFLPAYLPGKDETYQTVTDKTVAMIDAALKKDAGKK